MAFDGASACGEALAVGQRLSALTNPRGEANDDEHWMRQAISLAARAESEDEVPVGAVVVHEGRLVGEGWNRTITLNDPSAHAEILALRAAGQALGNYRLPGAVLYVTLEPCCMCVGAMIHARVKRLVFAAADPKTGAVDGRFSLLGDAGHNHRIEVAAGCLQPECSTQLQSFFQRRRQEQARPASPPSG